MRIPAVAAVKMTPVLIALNPRSVWRNTETMNVIPISSSHWMFWVTSPRFEVRLRNRLGGQQRLLARSLAGADVEEEPEQERGAEREEDDQQRVVVAGLQDPDDQERHAGRGQDGSDAVEWACRVRRYGVGDLAG